jgi:hypothetical protein
MTYLATIVPVLAKQEDAIAAVIIFIITVVGWIVKLANTKTQKGPPVASRPRPPVRPRDDRLQQEINIFVEDNTGRRSQSARPSPAAARTQQAGSAQAKRRPPAAAPVAKKKVRPGEELSRRHAPGDENLGTGVRRHISQHMTDRVTQEAQNRIAPRVEDQVAADLGTTVTRGADRPSGPARPHDPVNEVLLLAGTSRPPVGGATRPTEFSRAQRLAELLRSPAGVQQAIVLNLILSPPPGRTGSHRR